jgi:hypothetical protein
MSQMGSKMRHARGEQPKFVVSSQADLSPSLSKHRRLSPLELGKEALMPGPPPEHPRLRLLKGNPGKRRVRVPPEPARCDECPPPPEHLN